MSFGLEGWKPWAWNRGLTEGISRFTRALDRNGMLLVAAAGNDGDEETGGFFGDFDHPCHNDGGPRFRVVPQVTRTALPGIEAVTAALGVLALGIGVFVLDTRKPPQE